MSRMGRKKASDQDGTGKPYHGREATVEEIQRRDDRACPNPLKGRVCGLCGGTYVCLESWRKKIKPAG